MVAREEILVLSRHKKKNNKKNKPFGNATIFFPPEIS